MKKMWYSRLGEFLGKIVKEDDGAVMMEYVLLGTVIALAVLVGTGVLGYAINKGFAALSEGAVNKPSAGVTILNQTRDELPGKEDKATDHLGEVSPDIP